MDDIRTSPDRPQRVSAVVDSWIAARKNGGAPTAEELLRSHPDLMPELGRRLERLQAIERAASLAQQQPAPDRDLTGIEFLRRNLPGYTIHEKIDFGGQGAVYRALQKSTNRMVAIKVLLAGPFASRPQLQRFQREVELIARLKHPHIVGVFDSGEVDGRPYLVMEYIDGLPITDYALLTQPPLRQQVELFRKVCLAVSTAHQHTIIHRDLKPSNILVDDDGEPHVLDFGLAKDVAADEQLSIAGQVVGTLPYLSPEQAQGQDDQINTCSDIYALGVILYELLTGCFPYPVRHGKLEDVQHILHTDPRPIRSLERSRLNCGPVPEDLERIILKALEKEPGRRYQSAAALADDLGRFLTGDAVEARGQSGYYLLRKTARRYRVPLAFGAVILVLLMVSLVVMAGLWKRAERIARLAQAGQQMTSLLLRGGVERDTGRIDAAADLYKEAIAMAAEIHDPDDAVRMSLFQAHQGLGSLLNNDGRASEATEHCAAALALAERQLGVSPDDPEWRRALGMALETQANNLFTNRKYADALTLFLRAQSIRAGLVAEDPANNKWQSDLAEARMGIAKCHRKFKDFDAAQASLRLALEWQEERVVREPENVDAVIDLARTEAEIANLELRHQDPAHNYLAAEWLETAKKRLQDLKKSNRDRARRGTVEHVLMVIDQNLELFARRVDCDREGHGFPDDSGDSSPAFSSEGSED